MVGQSVATEAPVDLNAILNAPSITDGQGLKAEQGKPITVVSKHATPPPDPGISFELKQFRQSETTGIEFGKHSEKKYSLEQDKVTFSPELQAQFKSFLSTHVESLLRISNPQVLDNPQHIHEKKLLQVLTKGGQLDKNALDNFLKTSEGWSITEMLVENQLSLKIFSQGLEASIDPQGTRSSKIGEQTIYLHADQSKLNYWLKERFGSWLTEQRIPEFIRNNRRALALTGGIEAGMTAEGALLSRIIGRSPVEGALVGASLLPAMTVIGGGAIGGAQMLFRDGIKIDLTRCGETLKTIKGIRGESEYMLQVLGIDVNNVRVNAAGQVEKNPGHVNQGRSAKDVQNEIFQELFVTRQFKTALGIPASAVDALSEQFLFNGAPALTGASAEQTGTWYGKRIQEKLGASALTSTSESKRLKAFMQARKEVMMEYLVDHLVKVADNTDSTQAISRFEEKKRNKGTGGAELAEKKVASDKKIADLEKEKAKLEDPKKAAEAYQEAQKAVETALEAFKKDYPAVGIDTIGTIIDQLNKDKNDIVQNGSIAFRKHALVVARQTALDNAMNAIYQNLPNKGVDIYIKEKADSNRAVIDAQFNPQLQQLEEEATALSEKISNLKVIKSTHEKAQKDLLEKSQTLLGHSGRVNLITIEGNYKIVGTGGLPNSIGIQDTQLGVLTIDEIMVEINRANSLNNANGWPEAKNNDPANRLQVVDAIAEAKARLKEAIDPDKADRDQYFQQITGFGNPPISDVQLRTLSRSQLLNLIHISNGAGNGGWAIARDAARGPELDKAIAEAKNRMILRYSGTVEERIKDLTHQAESEKERMENISFKDDLDVLDVVGDLMNHQGKVFENGYAIAANREQFANSNKIESTDSAYSQAEKDVDTSQGYWEIMDVMLDYKTRVDRSSFVPKMLKALPPEALAREIYEHLHLAGVAIPANGLDNITNALTLLNTSIQGRSFNGFHTRRLFADIVNNLRAKADAI